MQLQIVENIANILAIVNTSNSFTKEFMETHREVIKTHRAAKKERLMQLTPSQIGTLIEQSGLVLVGEKRRILKNGTVAVTMTLRGQADEKAKLLAQKAKIDAQLAKMEEKTVVAA